MLGLTQFTSKFGQRYVVNVYAWRTWFRSAPTEAAKVKLSS